jgi:hypothetical protein
MGLDICAYMALVTFHTLAGKVGNHQSDSGEAPDLGGDSQALFYEYQTERYVLLSSNTFSVSKSGNM